VILSRHAENPTELNGHHHYIVPSISTSKFFVRRFLSTTTSQAALLNDTLDRTSCQYFLIHKGVTRLLPIFANMPLFEVEHICHLSEDQLDMLAQSITKIHSEQFKTPALFVNIRFTNIASHVTYVAGKRVRRRILSDEWLTKSFCS